VQQCLANFEIKIEHNTFCFIISTMCIQMSLLDIDSIISIFSLLTTKVLVKQREVCKLFKNIISENIKSFNIDVSSSKITDYQLKQVFTNCRIINLGYCNKITDNGLKHLVGVHTIELWNCSQITDNGRKYLKNIGATVFG
jgi:hypothetical protein